MGDYTAYDGQQERMVDLRTCTNDELREWLESSEMHGNRVVAKDCRTLLDQRCASYPGKFSGPLPEPGGDT